MSTERHAAPLSRKRPDTCDPSGPGGLRVGDDCIEPLATRSSPSPSGPSRPTRRPAL